MFKFLVLTTLLALGGVAKSESGANVGTSIPIKPARHMVVLEKSINGAYDGFCSGAILSNRWIITSAQCMKDVAIYGHGYQIRAGTANRQMGGMLYNVTQIQRWNDSTIKGVPKREHDIALIKVDPALELNSDTMRAALLPESNYTPNEGNFLTLNSWDGQEKLENHRGVIHQGDMKVIGNDICKMSYLDLPSDAELICTESIADGGDFVFADLGDPLTKGDYIVGIVLRYSERSHDQESIVYTEIAPYVNWINGIMH